MPSYFAPGDAFRLFIKSHSSVGLFAAFGRAGVVLRNVRVSFLFCFGLFAFVIDNWCNVCGGGFRYEDYK